MLQAAAARLDMAKKHLKEGAVHRAALFLSRFCDQHESMTKRFPEYSVWFIFVHRLITGVRSNTNIGWILSQGHGYLEAIGTNAALLNEGFQSCRVNPDAKPVDVNVPGDDGAVNNLELLKSGLSQTEFGILIQQ